MNIEYYEDISDALFTLNYLQSKQAIKFNNRNCGAIDSDRITSVINNLAKNNTITKLYLPDGFYEAGKDNPITKLKAGYSGIEVNDSVNIIEKITDNITQYPTMRYIFIETENGVIGLSYNQYNIDDEIKLKLY